MVQGVRMELFVLWRCLMEEQEVEWSFVTLESGALFVITTGMITMLALCADSWDYQLTVTTLSNIVLLEAIELRKSGQWLMLKTP